MKKFFSIFAGLLLAINLLAQAPQKMSYQAVIRNASNTLIVNQSVGIRISIIQGTIFGASVYVETHTASTNANGLVSLEIGSGNILNGNFNTINWANGPYFIKTETDPTGGTSYTISGTSQLLSVPYAMHAKTAENITGSINEVDPVFNSSTAKKITATDTTRWNNKLSSYTETDPVFNTSLAKNITATDTSKWNNKLSSYTETDPIFNSSLAKNITATDTSKWNNKLSSYTETDPIFNSSLAKNITATDTSKWNNKLSSYTETDPIFNSSLAKNITATDTIRWNNKLSSYTETDPIFNTSLAKNITATDTSRWSNKQNQLVAGSNISIIGNTIMAKGFTHYIGEHFGGGVIFHLCKDSLAAEHGLIVAKTNLSSSYVWSSNSALLIGATAQSSWDGLSNSNAIVAMGGISAAKLCIDLVSGGQSDWYLPSIDELSLLWHNRFNVNKTLSTINGATVFPLIAHYWSSTENTTDNSWAFDFLNGTANTYGLAFKNLNYNVRAIRAF